MGGRCDLRCRGCIHVAATSVIKMMMLISMVDSLMDRRTPIIETAVAVAVVVVAVVIIPLIVQLRRGVMHG